jgi:hypothetical protein
MEDAGLWFVPRETVSKPFYFWIPEVVSSLSANSTADSKSDKYQYHSNNFGYLRNEASDLLAGYTPEDDNDSNDRRYANHQNESNTKVQHRTTIVASISDVRDI